MSEELKYRIYMAKMKYRVTQTELAQKIGMNRGNFNNCINGRRQLPEKYKEPLIKILEEIEQGDYERNKSETRNRS